MRTFLVTGGAGFIGSHLTAALVERGDRVRVIDDLATGSLQNLAGFEQKIEIVQRSILDEKSLMDAVTGVDCIFHLAALPSVSRSMENPLASHAVCATGTLQVLEAARRVGARRVVYASSSSIYGDQPTLMRNEIDQPAPLSPYAVAKLTGEHYCRIYAQSFGVETVALRFFNVFGPRQDPTSVYSAVIPRFITAMLAGRQPVIYGDGLQSRDFTFVGNVVEGILLAANASNAVGRAINLATGRSVTLLELLAEINRLLEKDVAPGFVAARAGEVRTSQADITLARELLDYSPQYSFEEGLARCVDFYRRVAVAA